MFAAALAGRDRRLFLGAGPAADKLLRSRGRDRRAWSWSLAVSCCSPGAQTSARPTPRRRPRGPRRPGRGPPHRALVARSALAALHGRGPAGVRRLHRRLVRDLPGQRADRPWPASGWPTPSPGPSAVYLKADWTNARTQLIAKALAEPGPVRGAALSGLWPDRRRARNPASAVDRGGCGRRSGGSLQTGLKSIQKRWSHHLGAQISSVLACSFANGRGEFDRPWETTSMRLFTLPPQRRPLLIGLASTAAYAAGGRRRIGPARQCPGHPRAERRIDRPEARFPGTDSRSGRVPGTSSMR